MLIISSDRISLVGDEDTPRRMALSSHIRMKICPYLALQGRTR